MFFRSEPSQIRPAAEADRQALRRLLQSQVRIHVHTDWRTPDDYLGESPYLVAESGGRLVACLACPPDPPPAAWLRLAAVADGRPARDFAALLDAGLSALGELGAQELAVLEPERWLRGPLQDAGFRPLVDVITYAREDNDIPDRGAPDVQIRPAQLEDLPALVALDAAAFEPRWRHSVAMLRAAHRAVVSFDVAWLDGMPVGYQFSSTYGRFGHLARLAIHPDYQGRRIGTRLLISALTSLKQHQVVAVTLNTQTDNEASRRLYERFGFHRTGERAAVWQSSLPR
jgi:ribosomal-protein-alanine N-acetyltransferase